MSLKDKLLNKISNPKLKKALENPATRARVLFVMSILGALTFVAFNAVAGVLYRSVWYGALAVYYIMLVLMKIFLVAASGAVTKIHGENPEKLQRERWKIYLINGVALLLLDMALTTSAILMTQMEKPSKVGKIFAIATAAYAFFKITTAIINAVKTRKTDDVILQVIRNINLAAATVSMLALTSTMISTFGTFAEERQLLVVASVGVGFAIVAMGLYMIVKGATKLKALSQKDDSKD